MDDMTPNTLADDDMVTTMPAMGAVAEQPGPKDGDDTDAQDADGTDATDGADSDSTDGTDGTDTDGADAGE